MRFAACSYEEANGAYEYLGTWYPCYCSTGQYSGFSYMELAGGAP